MIKRTLSFIFLLSLLKVGFSQELRFGAHGGLTLSTLHRNYDIDSILTLGANPEAQFRPGLMLGVGGRFYFNPEHKVRVFGEMGVAFEQKGYNWKMDDFPVRKFEQSGTDLLIYDGLYNGTVKVSLNYFTIPFTLGAEFPVGPGHLQVSGSFFGALVMSGKRKENFTATFEDGEVTDYKGTLDLVKVQSYPDSLDPTKFYLNESDMGFALGLGYRLNNLEFQLSYAMGLRNLVPELAFFDKNPAIDKNRNLRLTIGYYLPVFD